MKKTCKYCNDEFTGNNKRLFCSDRCRIYSFRVKNGIPENPFPKKDENLIQKLKKWF